MFKNYLKIALRNLTKHRTFSLINILGLTGGLVCCLLIFIYVSNELSYDRFHTKKDRIYRVEYLIGDFDIASIPPVFATHFSSFFPEMESAARMFQRNISVQIDLNEQAPAKYEEERVWFADSSVFEIFDFEFLDGQIERQLTAPYSVILNEEIATKYFPGERAIGKTILMEGRPFKVSALARDFPSNSHLHFNILAPYDNMYDVESEPLATNIRQNFKLNYMVSHSYTYVLLHEGTNPEDVNARFVDFVDTIIPENMRKGQSFKLQPLLDIHLNADVGAQPEPPGNLTFLYVFIAVGALTLIIACINFVNLSTARSLERTREIGMRKVLGAWKTNLINQFLGESFVTTALAAVLAYMLTFFLLPVLNDITGKSLEIDVLYTVDVLVALFGLFVVTSILAGIYPAFFVTKISPVYSIKGMSGSSIKSGLSFRRGLIVVQLAISILLISGTLIVRDQLDFLQSQPLGFQKEHMINVPIQSRNFNNVFGGIGDEKRQAMNAFEDALATIPGVMASTASANAPGQGVVNRNVVPEGFTAEDNMLGPVFAVDYDFIETYDIGLVSGRNFSKEYATDHTDAFLINQEAIKAYNFGSPEEALGKTILVDGSKEGKVVGTIEDFNFLSLSQPIGPMIMEISVPQFSVFSIKIDNNNITQTIASIEQVWNEHFPHETFDYMFLDEQLTEIYIDQQRLGKVVSNFSLLAILISCLGAYGMIMFVVSQRMKEIGIRKVLGASALGLVLMLSRRFIWLALISMLLAVPAAYSLADMWLSDFAYRVDISPTSFGIAGLLTLLLVLMTIGLKAFRTALANPVEALRNE